VVRGSREPDQRINDGASALWLDADTRLVVYDGWVAGLTSYRLVARVGGGAP
jgi:hypothetical protein